LCEGVCRLAALSEVRKIEKTERKAVEWMELTFGRGTGGEQDTWEQVNPI
jgi:hypothetical protein